MKRIFILIFILSFIFLYAEDYYSIEPFILSLDSCEMPLLGNADIVIDNIPTPFQWEIIEANESESGYEETKIEFEKNTTIRFSSKTKNILDVTSSDPEIEISGIRPIGKKIEELLNNLPYTFDAVPIKGKIYYLYADSKDYDLTGITPYRKVEGSLQIVFITRDSIVESLYMLFSEYVP